MDRAPGTETHPGVSSRFVLRAADPRHVMEEVALALPSREPAGVPS